jgi:DivIVA domain-containing protein
MGKTDTKSVQPRKAVTPVEVQQKEFRVSKFGGYKMRDVDEFLDLITDTLSAMIVEIERLRALEGSGPLVGAPDLGETARQADEIIARARREAEEVVDRARTEASALAAEADARDAESEARTEATTSAERAALGAFLTNERAFLQNLAALIQGHAESVKELARSSRSATSGAADAPTAAVPVPPKEQRGVPDVVIAEPGVIPEPPAVVVVEDHVEQEAPPIPDDGVRIEQVTVDEPEPASVGPGEETENTQDRSLRDLFWGED